MKAFVRIVAVAAALFVANAASAQDQGTGRFGVGVGISDGELMDTLLFVPLNVTPNIRIEPFVGLSRADLDAPDAGGAVITPPGSGKSSDLTLGAGVFFVQPVASQIQLYAGGRLGLEWESFEDAGPNPDKVSRRNTILAGALGGEWLPHPRFALGAELMLAYVAYGDTEFDPGAPGADTVESGGGSASATQGTIFARVYLF